MLKLVYDKQEDIPAEVVGLYVEKDGKWHLKLEGAEDFSTMRQQRDAARRSERQLQSDLDRWKKLGKTDAEIVQLLEDAQRKEQQEQERRGEWESLKNQLMERHQRDLKAKDDAVAAEQKRAAALRSMLERNLIRSTATAAIANAKGTPWMLEHLVDKFIRVKQGDDGEFSTMIVDDKGHQRINSAGVPYTADDLLNELKTSPQYGMAFAGSGHSGSGSHPGGGGSPNGGSAKPGAWPEGLPKSYPECKTVDQKAAFLQAKKASEAAAKAPNKPPA